MRRASRPSALPWCRWLSSIAASRLWAAVMAWKSPVKWRLMSSIGADLRPAAAGGAALHAEDGAERGLAQRDMVARAERVSRRPSPTVVVDLPSPAGVGVMPVTSTSLPARRGRPGRQEAEIDLGLVAPVGVQRRVGDAGRSAISWIGRSFAARAISRSVAIRRNPPGRMPPRLSSWPAVGKRRREPAAALALRAAWQVPASISAATTRKPAGASVAA